jgi:hypothetical protein
MGVFGVLAILVLGILLISVGYAYDEKLKQEYHASAPTAFVVSGGIVVALAGLIYLRMYYFKKGAFFDYIGVSMITNLLLRGA